ncbi:hypothetical protein ACHWQZ_G014295 [Mnemiopsis leidyi]
MKSQNEVESQARAEISKKKAELLRIQEELNRKLKSAERQRNKRRKPDSSLLEVENKLKPLPVFTVPFSIKPGTKLLCHYQFKLTDNIRANNPQTTQPSFQSAQFLYSTKLSSETSSYPAQIASHVLLRTKTSIFVVRTESWKVEQFDLSPDLHSYTDHVFLFGEDEILLGIDKKKGTIANLKTCNIVYECKSATIETYCYSKSRVFLSVCANSETPSYQILALCYDAHFKTLSCLSQFSSPHLIVSLKHMTEKLVGTSADNIYIWSLEGELCGELTLPGSDQLICRAARYHNAHTFLVISCGSTLYSLVLSPDVDDQRLIAEVETQGNVFVCGFYGVYSHGGGMLVHNLITERRTATFDLTGMTLLDVSGDNPLFLFGSGNSAALCHLDIPVTV